MADQRIPELAPVVTPALTDRTNVRQAGDTRDKFETIQQIVDLVPPSPQGLGIWKFRTEIVEPPAAGQVRFNNADVSLATELYISETNSSGPTDVSAFMDILLIPGSVLFMQDRTDAANRVFIECGAVTDEGTYRKVIITSITEVGVEPSNNDDVLVVVQTAAGGGGLVFPEIPFEAKDFDNPNNADWDVNALAPAVVDDNNNALTVRAFDDTIVEGVGGKFLIPPLATNMVFSFVGRAQTAPGVLQRVRTSLRVREIPDNATVISPPWITANLTEFDIPTNEFFQFDSQAFTTAFFGFLISVNTDSTSSFLQTSAS